MKRRETDKQGLSGSDDLDVLTIRRLQWLDMEPRHLTHAKKRRWERHKVIINGVRRSRGPWRLVAIADVTGLVFSQQLLGLWPKSDLSGEDLWALAAVLSGPVANAFIATHSPGNRFRIDALRSIPLPSTLPSKAGLLARQYSEAIYNQTILNPQKYDLSRLLSMIDASILEAYDLPPRLERELLEYFRGAHRPVAHDWQHWYPKNFEAFLPLHRYLSEEFRMATSGWALEAFKPLPNEEASALREYLD